MGEAVIGENSFCICGKNKKNAQNMSGQQQPLREPPPMRPRGLCETRSGDLAFVMGRLRLSPGRPMLVEHLGGVYLEHDMTGRVLTGGYGSEFDIMHLLFEDA